MDLGFKLCVRCVNQGCISQAFPEESMGRVYGVFLLFGGGYGCGAVLVEIFGCAEGRDFASGVGSTLLSQSCQNWGLGLMQPVLLGLCQDWVCKQLLQASFKSPQAMLGCFC